MGDYACFERVFHHLPGDTEQDYKTSYYLLLKPENWTQDLQHKIEHS
jgi:hypothetical protein